MPRQIRTLHGMDTMMDQMGMSKSEKKQMNHAMKNSGMTGIQTISSGGNVATKDELRRLKIHQQKSKSAKSSKKKV